MSRVNAHSEPILWATGPPPSITCYLKLNMHRDRRVQWVLWKARTLTQLDYFEFFAIFKHVSMYRDNGIRLEQFKKAAKVWRPNFKWKDLDKHTQNRIKNLNNGVDDSFCDNCQQLLAPHNTTSYCSESCASQFCKQCKTRKDVREVLDRDELRLQQRRLGDYRTLTELAVMTLHKDEVSLYKTRADLGPEFRKLDETRLIKKCCPAHASMMADLQCNGCRSAFQHLNKIGNWVDLIASGKVDWTHCEVAAQVVKKLQDLKPMKAEKFCQGCEAEEKKLDELIYGKV